MARRLVNRIVLITGAAGTIGGAIAEAVAREGGTAVRSDLKGRGGDYAHDVTLEDDWIHVISDIGARHSRLDGLVNCAGVGILGSVEETSFDDYRRTMEINVDGTFLGCKHSMPLLRRHGGSIVNISSISGIVAGHNLAAYNASKGAVRLLSKSVALHGARLRPPVRCNSVHPTFVEGTMVDALLHSTAEPEKTREKMLRDIPLRRFAQPKEIADLVLFLLSDESAYITGAEIPIDGGLSAR
jgi:NAD(P)-dependent dehydrogenase (short-subunit alcohol dehydrogenase family)